MFETCNNQLQHIYFKQSRGNLNHESSGEKIDTICHSLQLCLFCFCYCYQTTTNVAIINAINYEPSVKEGCLEVPSSNWSRQPRSVWCIKLPLTVTSCHFTLPVASSSGSSNCCTSCMAASLPGHPSAIRSTVTKNPLAIREWPNEFAQRYLIC